MKKILVLLLGAWLANGWASCPPRDLAVKPDKVVSKNGWKLKIWVTAKGTRSEGRIARLYHHGKEICPQGGKEQIVTPIGTLMYQDPKPLWGWHGWKLK